MPYPGTSSRAKQAVDEIYRLDSRRVYATLVRLLDGDFDLAEESMHEAFAVAVERWERDGIPDNPCAWLVSTGRFKAIDTIRRRQRFASAMPELAPDQDVEEFVGADPLEDDLLRLIFTCCHPALTEDARVALTLREVCGLTTEEIARAFLAAPSTLAQRIVRAKAKIRKDGIPYQVPQPDELPDRLETVLRVVYLVFNEGYTASFGTSLTRPDLSTNAIHLARILVGLMDEPEIRGLLALMLLVEARRPARTSPDGDLVPLEEQDRSLWNRDPIAEGRRLIAEVFATGRIGPYTLQAAIAAEHAIARDTEATNWSRIVALYELLDMLNPSPVVELNKAVAIAMRDSPEAGLALVDAILQRGDLEGYHPAHAARADMLHRVGRDGEARAAYTRALELVTQEQERRFLKRRLVELGG
jgi:RNA polymerase sigma-70 factor, ECF subfamily